MEFILGYGAGLLTLINPCVLPVLPIVLASALQSHKRGPLALATGMSVTFVLLGVGVATLGTSIGLDAERVNQFGVIMMLGFGVILLISRLNSKFALATAGVASGADMRVGRLDQVSFLEVLCWAQSAPPALGRLLAAQYPSPIAAKVWRWQPAS